MNNVNKLHYPSLDRCKKLTELGFPKTENSFSDFDKGVLTFGEEPEIFKCDYRIVNRLSHGVLVGHEKESFVCPSVMEMIDVIPKKKVSMSVNIHPRFVPVSVDSLFYDFDHKNFGNSSNSNIPNALAALIIWLVENSHLTFDKR